MDELTCEECGTINDADRDVCELCGDPLGEERETAERKSLLFLVFAALVATILSYVGGAVLTLLAVIGSGAFRSFGTNGILVIYTVVWVLGTGIAPMYSPKENYDFGGVWGKPFSYQDDLDRGHAMTGCLLAPLMMVHGLWRKVFGRLSGDDERRH